jgi:beta-lysine 5,6-aminomutase alpha subunit
MPHLKLDQGLVNEARTLAQYIVAPVIDYIGKHTTVAIERTTLRLIEVDGVDEEGVPLPNRVIERAKHLLPGGVLRPFVAAMLHHSSLLLSSYQGIGTL